MAFQIYYDADHVYLFPSEDFAYYLAGSKVWGGNMYFIPADAKMRGWGNEC